MNYHELIDNKKREIRILEDSLSDKPKYLSKQPIDDFWIERAKCKLSIKKVELDILEDRAKTYGEFYEID